uniref:Uncharacterized protein n=1 Tax=Parascaris univalens TaxID=6257 RepID=A0A915C4W6_PARUN
AALIFDIFVPTVKMTFLPSTIRPTQIANTP